MSLRGFLNYFDVLTKVVLIDAYCNSIDTYKDISYIPLIYLDGYSVSKVSVLSDSLYIDIY